MGEKKSVERKTLRQHIGAVRREAGRIVRGVGKALERVEEHMRRRSDDETFHPIQ